MKHAAETIINPKQLREETWARIHSLLVRHEWNGITRGLYTPADLNMIRHHLERLADWLSENEPDFLREADEHFTNFTRFNEKTVLCISYIDHVVDGDKTALKTLKEFFNEHLAGRYSHLHILPFFPSPVIHEDVDGPASRADGGFEAMNYKLDPKFGDPQDMDDIQAGLMFDFVLNHLSSKGLLFENYLNNVAGYEDFFVTIPSGQVDALDLTPVFRPREHNPIVPYRNAAGEIKNVWCTFSETQADINIKDPRVFCAIMDALVKDFIGRGASWIRLDAVGYLVKMLGITPREAETSCFGIGETHNILKAMRAFLSDIAPSVTLVPEVNAPESVIQTYYGTNNDEGHLVYEFPSAPLSLYAIYAEDAGALVKWSQQRNEHPDWIGLAFTGSHDGIGVLPMEEVGFMPDGTSAQSFLLGQIERRGGAINYKSKFIDGEAVRVPYEACITWLQAVLSPPETAALKGDRLPPQDMDAVVDRFMASQSFIYTAPHCVPADYMGVIAGLLNDEELYAQVGHRRNKNRGQIDASDFQHALDTPKNDYDRLRKAIFTRKNRMIEARKTSPAFSPYAVCEIDIAKVDNAAPETWPVYSIMRQSPINNEKIIALTNCTAQKVDVYIDRRYFMLSDKTTPHTVRDILDEVTYTLTPDGLTFSLRPHQVCWLRIVPVSGQ